MHGHSLLSLIKGEAVKWPRDYAFSAFLIPEEDKVSLTVTGRGWTLVLSGHKGDKPELFNIEEDPRQEDNLYGQHKEIEKQLSEALIRFLESVGAEENHLKLIKSRLP